MKKELIPIARPTTELELEKLQRQAYSLATRGDYESALALCNWLAEEASTRVAGLRQRSAVREHQGEVEKAIQDLETVVSAGVAEPSDLHALGMLYLQAQRDIEAEQALAKGIEICLRENAPYYLNSCRLLRAEAALRIGSPDIALTELGKLPPGYSAHVYGRGLRTKEDIFEEAEHRRQR